MPVTRIRTRPTAPIVNDAAMPVPRVRVRVREAPVKVPHTGTDGPSASRKLAAAPARNAKTKPVRVMTSRGTAKAGNVALDQAEIVSSRFKDGNVDQDGDFIVGKGRPPKSGQIQPGEIRSPGRPKGSKNNATIAERELNRRVAVRENGRVIKVTKRELAIRRQVDKAASGDGKALESISKMEGYSTPAINNGPVTDAHSGALPPSDQEILDFMRNQIREELLREIVVEKSQSPTPSDKKERDV